MIRIYDTDTYAEVAFKIFNQFDLNQSCTVIGWVQMEDLSTKPKGELVLDMLRELDKAEYLRKQGKKMVRKRKMEPDSIGGWIAQPIFKFKRVIDGNEVKYVIWRKQ